MELASTSNGIIPKLVRPLSLRYMCLCLGYNGKTVAQGINFLIEMSTQNQLHSINYYSEQEVAADGQLGTTKIIYIPGEAHAPFAVVIAGGGFNSVCMMQEAFPVAQKLHEAGYHVFMLKYRVGAMPQDVSDMDKRQRAFSDMGRAMTCIFNYCHRWNLSTENYSVWGFSAGARITLAWAANETYSYQAYRLPKPAMQAAIYTLPEGISAGECIPATFMAMGTKDEFYGKAGCVSCEKFCAALNELGIRAEFERVEGVKHGFGLGVGTAAEGWFERALKLWEEACHEGSQTAN